MKQSGGPFWELPLGRRDSKTASLTGSNNNIPAPNSTLQNLITLFKRQGLDEVDLVALSGLFSLSSVFFIFFILSCYYISFQTTTPSLTFSFVVFCRRAHDWNGKMRDLQAEVV